MSAISDLLTHYQHVIDKIQIITGSSGVFEVTVDGEVMYSKKQTGRHADPGEILELFTGLVGPIPRYGEE